MGHLDVAHRDGAEWDLADLPSRERLRRARPLRSRTRSAWSSSTFSRSCSNVGVAIVLASAVAASSHSSFRFRRAGGGATQITWLLLVAIVAVLLMFTMFVLDLFSIEQTDVLWIALLMVLVLGIPGATALAIFRYRLYDVDVVVSKTISYAGLALGIVSAMARS